MLGITTFGDTNLVEKPNRPAVLSDLALGISCLNNTEALQMVLSSVLNGTLLPGTLQLRFEGQIPGFAQYYVEQLTAAYRQLGVEISLHVGPARGIRATREWQLDNCTARYLWYLDDDVVCWGDTLWNFHTAYRTMCDHTAVETVAKVAYMQGSKADLNNRRGYGDFELRCHDLADIGAGKHNYNLFWSVPPTTYLPVLLADMGNIIVDVLVLQSPAAKGISFTPERLHTNAGGEDTSFGMQVQAAGLLGYWAPMAQAMHLEKPGKPRMSEHAYRKEVLLREWEKLGKPMSLDEFTQLVLSWEPVHTHA